MYILDTCALLDLNLQPSLLHAECKNVLIQQDSLSITDFTLIEISQKVATGKLSFNIRISDWLQKALPEELYTIYPITPKIAIDAYDLPGEFHKDPADRIIVATARVYGLTVITSDVKILNYSHVKSLKSR